MKTVSKPLKSQMKYRKNLCIQILYFFLLHFEYHERQHLFTNTHTKYTTSPAKLGGSYCNCHNRVDPSSTAAVMIIQGMLRSTHHCSWQDTPCINIIEVILIDNDAKAQNQIKCSSMLGVFYIIKKLCCCCCCCGVCCWYKN